MPELAFGCYLTRPATGSIKAASSACHGHLSLLVPHMEKLGEETHKQCDAYTATHLSCACRDAEENVRKAAKQQVSNSFQMTVHDYVYRSTQVKRQGASIMQILTVASAPLPSSWRRSRSSLSLESESEASLVPTSEEVVMVASVVVVVLPAGEPTTTGRPPLITVTGAACTRSITTECPDLGIALRYVWRLEGKDRENG
ncbi:hypothetical protein P389DRAFT_62612 [Cystobasidium minutum MCA 4210]|uniref:uncharacterized protein n=1 Tax=Cystobasidium minutum MCA 4210 TaxID=1397322 RepID=UPI0034CED620|eukprot:jgi/Rhomi1/62612/CE62611_211